MRGLLAILQTGLGMAELMLINPKRRGFAVARMYVDMVQFIHKGKQAVEADALMTPGVIVDDDSIIERTVQILIEYIKELSPKNFLGIYFDGIPPLAKVIEQRARRYEMEKPAPGKFAGVKITVGTAFMRNVTERVLSGLAENASILPPEVEVSTPSEKGEGEHKLANRIRDKDATQPGAKVIVADDGDVMVMALLNNWKDCYVYLDRGPPRPSHGLLSIGGAAERIRQRLGDTPTAVFDFCLMVILTGGNDFMPTILSARDRREILTQLLDMYGKELKGQPLMTNQGKEIVWSSVRTLITQLAMNEQRNLRKYAAFAKSRLGGRMPLLFNKSIDVNTGEITLPQFRRAWNEELYTPKVPKESLPESIVIPQPSQREIDADHAFSATQYLEGLSWTLTYMRTGEGPDWYYSSPYPPLFGDISRLLSIGTGDPVRYLKTLPPWEPQELAVYLLTILPRAVTEDLFGDTFVNAFSRSAGIGDLFPRKFRYFSPAEWSPDMKGKAILPPLDLDRISKVVAERIDVKDVNRNLQSLHPRVKFSFSKGLWISSSSSGSRASPPVTEATADYEVLDPVIESMTV